MFDKILIANRGEIACRIARTAKRMGIGAVAVYSEADRHALYVAHCDEAYLLGPAAAGESYLCIPRIIDAALKSGAEAIHPGYGFLSENPEFSEACAHNNIAFIGPPADAIRAMGSKSLAREIMTEAGVPLVAGYHGEAQSEETLKAAADRIGYPVLIKAVSGGGGKGMRIVHHGAEFAAALAAVKRESSASFADDRVLIEQYLPVARHVEIQIFADRHGNIIHLFDRDCSIQRRHQKVIEEAPAPAISDQLRNDMAAAAIGAAESIGYVGAGTVEFLLAPDERFYFIEMNTRLQVEHPVTEMITGQDLVEWQLMVAAGLPLPCAQQDLQINGHAIEARIYAENPDNDFLPATGTLAIYRPPPEFDWLRVDSGVARGDEIPPYYDPMIAKLIAWGENREAARKRLRNALAEFDIAGVTTNLGFLHSLIELEDFIKPAPDTTLIERNAATLLAGKGRPPDACLAIATLFEIGASAAADQHEQHTHSTTNGDPFSPWSPAVPWQLNLPGEGIGTFATGTSKLNARELDTGELDAGELEYTIRFEHGQAFAVIDGERSNVALTPLGGGRFQFERGGLVQTVSVDKVAGTIHVRIGGRRWALSIADKAVAGKASADTGRAAEGGGLAAPMPGTVIAVHVEENQRVTRGAPLLTLEAMKMEHTISAPHDGLVKQLFCGQGDQVREGDQLLKLSAAKD